MKNLNVGGKMGLSIGDQSGPLAMLTAADVAAVLRVKPQQVLRWARAGRLPGAQFGRLWRFKADTIGRVCEAGLTSVATAIYTSRSKTPRVGGKVLRSWRETPTQ